MQFENPDLDKTVKVPNWANQGQIFLDFIDINEKVKTLATARNNNLTVFFINLLY